VTSDWLPGLSNALRGAATPDGWVAVVRRAAAAHVGELSKFRSNGECRRCASGPPTQISPDIASVLHAETPKYDRCATANDAPLRARSRTKLAAGRPGSARQAAFYPDVGDTTAARACGAVRPHAALASVVPVAQVVAERSRNLEEMLFVRVTTRLCHTGQPTSRAWRESCASPPRLRIVTGRSLGDAPG
jgi:hypothetical protein